MFVGMNVCMSEFKSLYVCISVYMRICVHMYMRICVYAYEYTGWGMCGYE